MYVLIVITNGEFDFTKFNVNLQDLILEARAFYVNGFDPSKSQCIIVNKYNDIVFNYESIN